MAIDPWFCNDPPLYYSTVYQHLWRSQALGAAAVARVYASFFFEYHEVSAFLIVYSNDAGSIISIFSGQ